VSGGLGLAATYVFDLWNYDWEIQLQSNKQRIFFRFTDAFDVLQLRKYQMFTVVVLIIQRRLVMQSIW
jgi:hypothetical protein